MMKQSLVVLLWLCLLGPAQAVELRIAAASNLRYVLPDIAEQFEQKTGHQLAISYAASGTLTTQILHGAPFDLFLAASPEYSERLIAANRVKSEPLTFAHAQLTMFAPHHSTVMLDTTLEGLKSALANGKINKVAIANPKHAPYGKITQQLLAKYNLWQQLQPYLLTAENASQTVQFSLLPSVDIGFVPYSHIVKPDIARLGRNVVLELTLQQQAVKLTNTNPANDQFISFIQQKEIHDILLKHGFL